MAYVEGGAGESRVEPPQLCEYAVVTTRRTAVRLPSVATGALATDGYDYGVVQVLL